MRLRWACELSVSVELMLLGLDQAGQIHMEEMDADENLTQTSISAEGEIGHRATEESPDWQPVRGPLLAQPKVPATHRLNFTGPRYRGMRQEERISEAVQSLSIADKMRLSPRLGGQIIAPMILGIVESRVLSQALLQPGLHCVCRRIRVAWALPEVRHDEQGPYDYDCVTFYVAHLDDEQTDAPLPQDLDGLAGQALFRPQDCISHAGRLYIADAGVGLQPNRLHAWDLLKPDEAAL